jgi:hypothetical protein
VRGVGRGRGAGGDRFPGQMATILWLKVVTGGRWLACGACGQWRPVTGVWVLGVVHVGTGWRVGRPMGTQQHTGG